MLTPADIEARDFLVVVHGYHKGEVREFLTQVAASYAELTAAATASGASDDFESMGAEIANVLRAAKEAAGALTADAEERLRHATAEADEKLRAATAAADERLASASRDAEELLATAESIKAESARDAEQLRSSADAAIADARREADAVRAEADRIIAEAHEAARRIENDAREAARRLEDEALERAEAHHRGLEASIQDRLARLGEHEGEIRDRLLDLSAAVRAATGVLDTAAATSGIDLTVAPS